ncbi:hypothetical protein D3C81_1093250 [compost metagenome]
MGSLELSAGLGHCVGTGDACAVLVLGHAQRPFIRRDGGFQQALLLIDNAQLQVILHQLRLLAEADRGEVGEARLSTGLVSVHGLAQLAPQVDFPAHPKLRVVSVANTAAVVGKAGARTACALGRAVLAGGQVQAWEQRRTAAAHQRLGLAVLGFGLRHTLVAAVELLDQSVEPRVTIDFPPCATGDGIGRVGLGPALGLFELRRRAQLRAMVVRAQGTGA